MTVDKVTQLTSALEKVALEYEAEIYKEMILTAEKILELTKKSYDDLASNLNHYVYAQGRLKSSLCTAVRYLQIEAGYYDHHASFISQACLQRVHHLNRYLDQYEAQLR